MEGLTWFQETLIVQNGEAIDEEEDRLQVEDPVSARILITVLVLYKAAALQQTSPCPP